MEASKALNALLNALQEVDHLESINPTPTGAAPQKSEVTRVIGRAGVVLISSHLERYVRAVNEEVINAMNVNEVSAARIPVELRLLHADASIDSLAKTQWNKREVSLQSFLDSDGWLWSDGKGHRMQHDRLLRWLKSPDSDRLVRYYKYWTINDIFTSITKKRSTRDELRANIDALVTKRNNIAHGDNGENATQSDVRAYKKAVITFAKRSDKLLAKTIARHFGLKSIW